MGFFKGLAGLLQGISQGRSLREIPRINSASPRKTPSFPTLLLDEPSLSNDWENTPIYTDKTPIGSLLNPETRSLGKSPKILGVFGEKN